MLDTQNEIKRLRERVDQLEEQERQRERQRARTNRGHLNQRRAAEYIGKSREYLRQRELCGNGPPRNADGTYPIAGLDAFVEQDTT